LALQKIQSDRETTENKKLSGVGGQRYLLLVAPHTIDPRARKVFHPKKFRRRQRDTHSIKSTRAFDGRCR
jgi:hypothetical protein